MLAGRRRFARRTLPRIDFTRTNAIPRRLAVACAMPQIGINTRAVAAGSSMRMSARDNNTPAVRRSALPQRNYAEEYGDRKRQQRREDRARHRT